MKRSPAGFCLVFAAVILLGLSACAPATTGPSSSPTHKAHPHSTPTPSQAAVPPVRVPLKCSDLFSDATVSSVITTPVEHHIDETTSPVGITDIVARQYGSLVCLWGGADIQDGGYTQYLSVTVSPDAKAGFAANIAEIETEAGASTGSVAKNTAGDQSEYDCTVQGDTQCNSNMLVGTFWVTAYLTNLGGTVPLATANGHIQLVLKTIATALAGKTAAPAWNPPGQALSAFCSASGSTAKVNAALGATDLGPTGDDGQVSDATAYTQTVGTYTQCTWGSASATGKFTDLAVAVLKGGAWVLPQLPGERDMSSSELGPYTPAAIPGADAAVTSCSVSARECAAMVSIGGTLVFIRTDDPGTAVTNAALAKIVAAIASS